MSTLQIIIHCIHKRPKLQNKTYFLNNSTILPHIHKWCEADIITTNE